MRPLAWQTSALAPQAHTPHTLPPTRPSLTGCSCCRRVGAVDIQHAEQDGVTCGSYAQSCWCAVGGLANTVAIRAYIRATFCPARVYE